MEPTPAPPANIVETQFYNKALTFTQILLFLLCVTDGILMMILGHSKANDGYGEYRLRQTYFTQESYSNTVGAYWFLGGSALVIGAVLCLDILAWYLNKTESSSEWRRLARAGGFPVAIFLFQFAVFMTLGVTELLSIIAASALQFGCALLTSVLEQNSEAALIMAKGYSTQDQNENGSGKNQMATAVINTNSIAIIFTLLFLAIPTAYMPTQYTHLYSNDRDSATFHVMVAMILLIFATLLVTLAPLSGVVFDMWSFILRPFQVPLSPMWFFGALYRAYSTIPFSSEFLFLAMLILLYGPAFWLLYAGPVSNYRSGST